MSEEVKEVEMNVEETQGVKEEIAPNKPEVQSFKLKDEHVEILGQHASALQNYYAMIGQQVCEVIKHVEQASSIEKAIEELQNDIAKELKVPRANRLAWNLGKKILEVSD